MAAAVPKRLRPTASIATEAVLVGDPGRALLLAQDLLGEPKMSNHARGLWGYWGQTAAGDGLTIQATGMGGPSAVLVLEDLAELGVRRAVRVGTCVALGSTCELGELLLVTAAIAAGGSAASLGVARDEEVLPGAELTEHLREALGSQGRAARISSFDVHPGEQSSRAGPTAADMQTAPLLAHARSLDIEAAAVLIVSEAADDRESLGTDALGGAEKRAGLAAASALSG